MDPSDMNGMSGLTRAIHASSDQLATLKSMFDDGDLVSSETLLNHGQGVAFDDENIFLPPGLAMKQNTRRDRSRRRLAVVTGTKPILAVKVIDVNGLAHPHTPEVMSDNIFGTLTDQVNLKSQLAACSHGLLNVQAGTNPPASQEVAAGMVEVTIDVDLNSNSRGTIRNAVTTKVQALLGHGLPGPYQQVMYNLQGCYVECGVTYGKLRELFG
jgi:hypothetical protein